MEAKARANRSAVRWSFFASTEMEITQGPSLSANPALESMRRRVASERLPPKVSSPASQDLVNIDTSDRLPFTDVPICLYLRDKAPQETDKDPQLESAGVADQGESTPMKTKKDAAKPKLKFKTKLAEGEAEKFDSELWRDL